MNPATPKKHTAPREPSIGLRLATGLVGLILLLFAVLGTTLLVEGPWHWGLALGSLLFLLEGLDFVVAAMRHDGGWPTPATAFMNFLFP